MLREDLASAWHGLDPFEQARQQQGEVFRDKEGRRTLRFEIAGRGFFLKLHQGVGWREIFKNLLQFRLPVLGAENEYLAIKALEKLGIDTLSVAGYGRRGKNPARQLSFLITDELLNTESLEDFCARWPQQKPDALLKQRLIVRVADIARRMHRAGMNHRDFYLCHFLLDVEQLPTADNINRRPLYLMDLHRAQLRHTVPYRWQVKDLGGLYYSALDIGLTRRDVLRFIKQYCGGRLPRGSAWKMWQAVRRRAEQIYRRDHGKGPSSEAWQLLAPGVGR